MPKVTCYQHERKEASGTCSACLRPICLVCSMFDGMDEVCPPCLAPRRKKRFRRRVVTSAVLFVLASVGVAYAGYRVRTAPKLPPPPVTFDKGAYSGELKRLEAQLAAEPCDRAKIVTFGDTLVQVGDYRGALRSNE